MVRARKLSGRPKIGVPPVKIRASALYNDSPPNVTMNGCNPPHAISAPLTKPQNAPLAKANTMATGTGTPATSIAAASTPDSAATGPTDRSIPPEMITSVIPSAIQALIEDCCRILIRFGPVRNTELWVAKNPLIRINPSKVPASRNRMRESRGMVLDARGICVWFFQVAGMAWRAMFASVISVGPRVALICPSRITSTRSATRITSGISDDTTITARPSRARRSIRS